MKKKTGFSIWVLPAVILFMACHKSDDVSVRAEVTIQSVYANTGKVDFPFTVNSDWNMIRESLSWVDFFIDDTQITSGPAGEYVLTAQLQPNLTRESRSASVSISANGESLSFTVIQDAKNEAGLVFKLIRKAVYHDGESEREWDFLYDHKGRLSSYASPYGEYSFSYEFLDIDIIYSTALFPDELNEFHQEYTLNEQGAVLSWTTPAGVPYSHADYLYQDDGFLSQYRYWTPYDIDVPSEAIDIIWQNGNIAVCGESDRYEYTEYANHYNLDLAVLIGEFKFAGIYDQGVALMGLAGNRCANLISAWTTNSSQDAVSFEYDFDTDGYVETVYAVRSKEGAKEPIWSFGY